MLYNHLFKQIDITIQNLVFFFKNLFIATEVNGQIIRWLFAIKELEARGGHQTLESMIANMLILQ